MDGDLMSRRQPTLQEVCVQIAAEQQRLEEQHTGRPDGRRPAEPGQDRLAHHRLHLKQQKRAQENRNAEGDDPPSGRFIRTRNIRIRGFFHVAFPEPVRTLRIGLPTLRLDNMVNSLAKCVKSRQSL